MTQKPKFLSKSVAFGDKKLTLFSIDGVTWSTRKDELTAIRERHEAEKVTAAHLRGEPGEPGAQTEAAKAAAAKSKIPAAPPNRKFVTKYPHPAYAPKHEAAPVAKAEVVEQNPKANKKIAKVAPKAAAPKPSAQKASKVEAAPKKRGTSKPVAKKAGAKKKVAA